MKAVTAAAVLGLFLVAGPANAQTKPPQTPPPQAAAPAQPAPFPEGAKVAYVNIQLIADESAEGKAANAKVRALNDKKVNEIAEKNKALQANQQKLQQGGSVMSEDARLQLQKEIDRQQVDVQRLTQDAQAEVEELMQQLQFDFQRKLMPVIQQVSLERGIHLLFAADSGLVWADPSLDLTADVIKRLDQAGAGTAQR
jgi:outer membrane protein